MRNKKIASIKIDKLKIDVYDYEVLDHILAYVFKFGKLDLKNVYQNNFSSDNITIEDDKDSAIPSFLENNPWLELLAKRSNKVC
ncbi:MAG: hypothetical protein J7K82_05075 [Thermoproteales archaeon]|nr:hypothetical protein [Thermoproteales archaeon]